MSHETGQEVTLELLGLGYATARGDALVADVSFHVHAGEILAIAGPNGAGKSTLVRMIAGLMPAGSGEIRLGGRPLTDIPITERARSVAYVGQSEEPDGRLSVTEYVALGRLPHRRALDARAMCLWARRMPTRSACRRAACPREAPAGVLDVRVL